MNEADTHEVHSHEADTLEAGATDVDWIARSAHASIIHALRVVAWADDVVEEEEVLWVARLLRRLGVEVDDAVFRHWMNTPPTVSTPDESDTFNQLFLLDEAIRLAWADGSYQQTERRRIARWADMWSVSAEALQALEEEVAASLSSDPFG